MFMFMVPCVGFRGKKCNIVFIIVFSLVCDNQKLTVYSVYLGRQRSVHSTTRWETSSCRVSH